MMMVVIGDGRQSTQDPSRASTCATDHTFHDVDGAGEAIGKQVALHVSRAGARSAYEGDGLGFVATEQVQEVIDEFRARGGHGDCAFGEARAQPFALGTDVDQDQPGLLHQLMSVLGVDVVGDLVGCRRHGFCSVGCTVSARFA